MSQSQEGRDALIAPMKSCFLMFAHMDVLVAACSRSALFVFASNRGEVARQMGDGFSSPSVITGPGVRHRYVTASLFTRLL